MPYIKYYKLVLKYYVCIISYRGTYKQVWSDIIYYRTAYDNAYTNVCDTLPVKVCVISQ